MKGKKAMVGVNDTIRGEAASYRIVKELGRGGFGLTYLGKVQKVSDPGKWLTRSRIGIGSPVIIKVPNVDPSFSPIEKERRIHHFNETLDREENARLKLSPSPAIPKIYDNVNVQYSIGRSMKVRTRYLIGEYIEGEDLDKYLCRKLCNSDNPKDFRGIQGARFFFDRCRELAALVKYIHEKSVIHGDIWPRNVLVKKNGDPVFIDYGSAVFREYAFRRADPGQTAVHPYTAPERRLRSGVRREGRRSDIYSLGGVFFFLATGKAPPQPIKNDDALKKRIEQEIAKSNPALIKENRCVVDIIARCLRYKKDDRIPNANQLDFEIQTFSLDASPAPLVKSSRSFGRILDRECKPLVHGRDSLFCNIIEMELNGLLSQVKDMHRGILEVSGNHESIVSFLCQFLSILRAGDVYLDFSIPRFWSPKNLGINGRFLSLNEVIACRGVDIQRVFLVSKDELKKAEVRRIFKEHANVLKRIREASATGSMETYYRIISKSEQENAIQNSEHCGILIQKGCKPKFIIPVYSEDGHIVTVRFLSQGQGIEYCLRKMKDELQNENTRDLLAWKPC